VERDSRRKTAMPITVTTAYEIAMTSAVVFTGAGG
jgi:hypothetical protein